MRWLVLFGVVACGDNLMIVEESPETRGGERLELYWYEMEGGGREQVPGTRAAGGPGIRMFDREREEACEVLEWSDGKYRCTPGIDPQEAFGYEWPSTVFVDPSCTETRGLSSRPRTYFVHGEWIGERFVTSALVRSGDTFASGEYYERRDGACHGPIATDDSRYLWSVEGGFPGITLMTLVRDELATTARIGHEALVGEDGTRLHLGFFDRELATPCTLINGEDDVRCAPEGVEIEDSPRRTFADAACSTPAVADVSVDTRFAFEVSYDTWCSTHWELGPARQMPVFELDHGTCVPAGMGEYRAGSPITLPVVELALADKPGRIDDTLAAGATIGVYDTETRAACSTRYDWFGQHTKCMPNASWIHEEFRDPACLQPIEVTRQFARSCSRVARFATSDYKTFAEIGARIDELFTVIDERCVPLVPPDGYAYHTLGARISGESFARATLVHAP